MTKLTEPIDFPGWLEANEADLKPPVNNKQMFPGGADFIVQVVGAPNQRTDFHVDPYEEFFYQVKGDMYVDVVSDEGVKQVHIREGQMWVLPGNLPHSPQRPDPSSIGVVVERVRQEGTLEKFQWYCPNCSALLHEIELQVRDIVADLPPVFEKFYADTQARTCQACGTLHPGKG